ncbi:uncharacterized protein [Primulina eburnea]|uniref:uncharacterized protein n=1 Tax=Primulina eburnea TaxID=1245227 RepID=UPI003C6BE4B6
MASNFHRLRRAVSLSSSLIHCSLHRPPSVSSHPNIFHSISAAAATATSASPFPQSARVFTTTTSLFMSDQRKPFNPETDEIGPDTILFEGCDYNHWLITVDFPKDTELTREQKIEFYVNIAAQVFGSVEEAKKRIYALSTTTYEGFQVECSEETSNKFQNIPGVVFVLPDSYIDPVNKEYGGDKYVNGEIFPRPPPVHYGRRNNRDRRPRDQMSYQQGNTSYSDRGPSYSEARNHGRNYGPPQQQQNYGPPPPQQNYGPPSQQNYGPPPPPQQNYGPPPHQQNYGPPPQQQNYGPPPQQQNYGPPPQQQNYGLPSPQQGYTPPPQQQNYGLPPQQQGYERPPQQGYAPPRQQQNYGQPPNFPPQENYTPSGPGERGGPMSTSNALGGGKRNPLPSYQGNLSRGDFGSYNTQGHRDFQQASLQSHALPEHEGFSQDTNFLQARSFEQGSAGAHDQSTKTNVGQNQPKQGEEPRNFSYTANK